MGELSPTVVVLGSGNISTNSWGELGTVVESLIKDAASFGKLLPYAVNQGERVLLIAKRRNPGGNYPFGAV